MCCMNDISTVAAETTTFLRSCSPFATGVVQRRGVETSSYNPIVSSWPATTFARSFGRLGRVWSFFRHVCRVAVCRNRSPLVLIPLLLLWLPKYAIISRELREKRCLIRCPRVIGQWSSHRTGNLNNGPRGNTKRDIRRRVFVPRLSEMRRRWSTYKTTRSTSLYD